MAEQDWLEFLHEEDDAFAAPELAPLAAAAPEPAEEDLYDKHITSTNNNLFNNKQN